MEDTKMHNVQEDAFSACLTLLEQEACMWAQHQPPSNKDAARHAMAQL
jgi:hypothetical protein